MSRRKGRRCGVILLSNWEPEAGGVAGTRRGSWCAPCPRTATNSAPLSPVFALALASSGVAVELVLVLVLWYDDGNGDGIEGRLGQPITPSSTRASTNSARQTAYCPPRKNPFVPSIGSSVHMPAREQRTNKGYDGRTKRGDGRTSGTSSTGIVPSVNSLQKRIGAPALPKTPLSPLSFFTFTFTTTRTGRQCQDIVCELDDARTERPTRLIVRRSESEIRSVFLAYDRIIREGLGEDGVDDGLCRIVAHFFVFVCVSGRPSSVYIFYLFSRRTSYGAVVALDERLSCDELVEDDCG
jgi:hypothetical protein